MGFSCLENDNCYKAEISEQISRQHGLSPMAQNISIFWYRRDLRLYDNTGLSAALQSGNPVVPIFIFDRNILDDLEDKNDRRVDFIHQTLKDLDAELRKNGSGLRVYYGTPEEVWPQILEEFDVKAVYTNHDYEPYALKRDPEIGKMLEKNGVEFHTFKDQVIFEKMEVLTGSNTPYTVFTPYSKTWKSQLTKEDLEAREVKKFLGNFHSYSPPQMPSLEDMGFKPSGADFPPKVLEEELIRDYADTRNYPAIRGTSRLSVHLRFGTVSIRKLVKHAMQWSETWLNELIWREFYMQILYNFPHVVGEPFRAKYEGIKWLNDEENFKKWCEGKTGYPLVDAGMRELKETGFMHNRVRMVTASFLTKHLLIDWRWGEAWFARQLLDFELASNNGGWQWAAGTGTDAAPYFRIFNPESQMKKFDPKGKYVRKWVPEFGTPVYPRPIVEHKMARERCLEAYKTALEAYEE